MEPVLRISIRGPLQRDEVPALYRTVSWLLAVTSARRIRCDIEELSADAVAIDAIARLELAARRHRAALELTGASRELLELLAFTGLDRALEHRFTDDAPPEDADPPPGAA